MLSASAKYPVVAGCGRIAESSITESENLQIKQFKKIILTYRYKDTDTKTQTHNLSLRPEDIGDIFTLGNGDLFRIVITFEARKFAAAY